IADRGPVVRTDDFLADRSFGADEERLRISRRLERALDGVRGIMQDLEGHAEVLRVPLDGVLSHVIVDADGDDLEAFRSVLLLQPLETRDLDATWLTPGRPDVHEHHLALVVGERLVRRGAQLFRTKVRHLRSNEDREQLVSHEVRRHREPETEHEDHRPDDRPLFPRRHTVTPQRERSARISARGSGAEKIALPATKVSAPACHTLAIVSRLIPPSTSSAAPLPSSLSINRARRILSTE